MLFQSLWLPILFQNYFYAFKFIKIFKEKYDEGTFLPKIVLKHV